MTEITPRDGTTRQSIAPGAPTITPTTCLNWDNDPELMDMRVAALLLSLAERDGQALGPSLDAALRHAAQRLWEFWNDPEESDADDDGPFSLDAAPDREMMFR